MNKNWTPSDFLDDETPGSTNPQKLSVAKKKKSEGIKKERESGFAFGSEVDMKILADTPIPDTSFLLQDQDEEEEEGILLTDETFAPKSDEEEYEEEEDEESVDLVEEIVHDMAENSEEKSVEKEEVEEAEDKKLTPAGNAFDWLKTFIFSLTLVIFVFTLLFRGVTVNGNSMLPTLENGEYLIISERLYTPKTGDIVVVQAPDYKDGKEPLIKRVIATQGQEVTINFLTWQIWIDGVELKEDYILKDDYNAMRSEDMKPDENGEVTFTVEKGCVFLMGDNRNDSLDSRSEMIGQIDTHYIMGRVLIRITPFAKMGKVD